MFIDAILLSLVLYLPICCAACKRPWNWPSTCQGQQPPCLSIYPINV